MHDTRYNCDPDADAARFLALTAMFNFDYDSFIERKAWARELTALNKICSRFEKDSFLHVQRVEEVRSRIAYF